MHVVYIMILDRVVDLILIHCFILVWEMTLFGGAELEFDWVTDDFLLSYHVR